MKIKIVKTSSDNILKFETEQFLTDQESFEFNSPEDAQQSPLVRQLFQFPFVRTVYVTVNFIAIEKTAVVTWKEVQEEIRSLIATYLEHGKSIINPTQPKGELPITIYTEQTPNPKVLKFVANRKLTNQLREYKNVEEAMEAPLVKLLFNEPHIESVFIDQNYFSISKSESWNGNAQQMKEIITYHLNSGTPITQDQKVQSAQNFYDYEKLDDVSRAIVNLLNEHVKPAVARDGGNIAFHSYNPDSQVVKVVLQGACSGCPSSTVTLKNGIETMLKEFLPNKISGVEAYQG